jgi:glycosyltransferase involved in cell wall biosynthesis
MSRLLGFTTSVFDPASRFRFIQFIPHLKELGWEVVHRPNVPDRQRSTRFRGRIPRALDHRAARLLMKWNRFRDVRHAASADLVFVNRDLAGGGLFFERQLLRRNPRVIFDFDDAIFLGRNEAAVRWMCRNAAWVTPGNDYLASYARQYSDRVSVIPTVVDAAKYIVNDLPPVPVLPLPRVGWSGSDQSIQQTLFRFLPILLQIQQCIPFELVVITNTRPQLPMSSLTWSFVPWQEEQEWRMSSSIDIGIMPLADSTFERGKCGLKLLQYMAAGLPTIASPVGVNAEITEDGITGFLPRTDREWSHTLAILLDSYELRRQMGAAGRRRCVRHYSIDSWLPTIDKLFHTVAQQRQDTAMRATT